MFFIFQLRSRRFQNRQVQKIFVGFVYTYLGLVTFLTGANIGFMPAGHFIGLTLSQSQYPWLLIPLGMAVGYYNYISIEEAETMHPAARELGAAAQKKGVLPHVYLFRD